MLKDKLHFDKVNVQTLDAPWLNERNVTLNVLRLDRLHDTISGNKWFKLKYHLEDIKNKGLNTLATFGGAYSNHIVATAYAAKENNLKSIGIIRGEKTSTLSHTLQQAAGYGMELHFISREAYRNKDSVREGFENIYWIEEGGFGVLGSRGAGEILNLVNDLSSYNQIVCAVGTGTMLAGLANAARAHQQVTGISVLKNNFTIEAEVKQLTSKTNFNILHGYDFGGYAKHPPALIDFMIQTWNEFQLPTDIVYTSKTLYAIKAMVNDILFPQKSKILMIHSGGLQGNLSLPPNALPFL